MQPISTAPENTEVKVFWGEEGGPLKEGFAKLKNDGHFAPVWVNTRGLEAGQMVPWPSFWAPVED